MTRRLTVLYDADCPFTVESVNWLTGQRQLVPMRFVPANSAEARNAFPTLDHDNTLRKITVVADDGAVYTGDGAWLVCLWALRTWREAAIRFGRGEEHYGDRCDGTRAERRGREGTQERADQEPHRRDRAAAVS